MAPVESWGVTRSGSHLAEDTGDASSIEIPQRDEPTADRVVRRRLAGLRVETWTLCATAE
jgi:hypothetical protein